MHKKKLKRAIEKEGGSYRDILEDDTSYLVVRKVGSYNYYVELIFVFHE